ncbi:MAG: hypothetical protein IKS76_01745 [Paludibacteraceae bacterium]|nr:hypothetical protein [Paludibacteraceae bacterium]
MTNFKRYLTLFFVTILAVSVWGESQSFSPSTDKGTITANGTSTGDTFTKYGFTITSSNGVLGNGSNYRVYQGGTLSISSSVGTITAISFTFSGSYNGGLSTSYTSLSTTDWSANATSQARITDITVTYTPSSGSPTLSSISVSTAPTKVTYTEGEYFDPTGLVITRTYSNSTSDTYAYAGHASDFTFSPTTSTALTTSNTSVSITYSGKSTSQAITVTSGGGGGGGSTATFVWGSNPTKYTSESSSVTEGIVTFTGAKGTHATTPARCYSDGLRMYAGNTVTFSVPDGYVITKIEGYATFNYNNATGEQSVTFSGLSKATCGSDVTVTYSASGTTHTLSSTVSPTGTGTVTLGSTSVIEGATTTATATPNSGYTFSSWSISGTGASLSSTTANPTTVTMGTANATITSLPAKIFAFVFFAIMPAHSTMLATGIIAPNDTYPSIVTRYFSR